MRLNLLKRFALAAARSAGTVIAPDLPATATTITFADLAGRTVDVERNPGRVVLGEGHLIHMLALLNRDNPFFGSTGIKRWDG